MMIVPSYSKPHLNNLQMAVLGRTDQCSFATVCCVDACPMSQKNLGEDGTTSIRTFRGTHQHEEVWKMHFRSKIKAYFNSVQVAFNSGQHQCCSTTPCCCINLGSSCQEDLHDEQIHGLSVIVPNQTAIQ